MKRVMGVDLGIRHVAVCVGTDKRVAFHVKDSDPDLPNPLQEEARNAYLLHDVVEWLEGVLNQYKPAFVCVEMQAYGIGFGRSEKDLAELHGAAKVLLTDLSQLGVIQSFAFVTASEARKMVLGAGQAPRPDKKKRPDTKAWVEETLRKQGLDTEGRSHDELDAYVMADYASMQVNRRGLPRT